MRAGTVRRTADVARAREREVEVVDDEAHRWGLRRRARARARAACAAETRSWRGGRRPAAPPALLQGVVDVGRQALGKGDAGDPVERALAGAGDRAAAEDEAAGWRSGRR